MIRLVHEGWKLVHSEIPQIECMSHTHAAPYYNKLLRDLLKKVGGIESQEGSDIWLTHFTGEKVRYIARVFGYEIRIPFASGYPKGSIRFLDIKVGGDTCLCMELSMRDIPENVLTRLKNLGWKEIIRREGREESPVEFIELIGRGWDLFLVDGGVPTLRRVGQTPTARAVYIIGDLLKTAYRWKYILNHFTEAWWVTDSFEQEMGMGQIVLWQKRHERTVHIQLRGPSVDKKRIQVLKRLGFEVVEKVL